MNYFQIKENIDNLIYSTYNALSSTIHFFDFKAKKIISKNLNYRNIHLGKRCFIIGTGESLNNISDEKISRLSEEIIFGVNSFYKSHAGSILRPNYYTLIDHLYRDEKLYVFDEILNNYSPPPFFITDFRLKKSLEPKIGNNAIYICAKKIPTKNIDTRIDRNTYALINVVTTSIASAIFMGFKEIYLLGCDYNLFCSLGKSHHCYDDSYEIQNETDNLALTLKFYHLATECHYHMRRISEPLGVKIINLTEGSLLDAYQKMHLEDIIEKS